MGLVYVKMKVRKSKRSKRFIEQDFLVDSGATFTVVPATVLKRLGIEPDDTQDFVLANGQRITRKLSDAYFELGEKGGYSKVIFGQRTDSRLLGILTLGILGLVLDPLKRELKPLPMLLM